MINAVIEKYRSLAVINDSDIAGRLEKVLADTPIEEMVDLFAHSSKGGMLFMLRHESAPGIVMEYVSDQANEQSVMTLYQDHPAFVSKQSLIDAREEIIAVIDRHFMAVPNTVTVVDEGRGKEYFLVELGTAQLLDVLGILSKRAVR